MIIHEHNNPLDLMSLFNGKTIDQVIDNLKELKKLSDQPIFFCAENSELGFGTVVYMESDSNNNKIYSTALQKLIEKDKEEWAKIKQFFNTQNGN
jgi:hypothetical protein